MLIGEPGDLAEIRFRAERRLGELMAAQREAGLLDAGGRPKTGFSCNPVSAPIPLAEAGGDPVAFVVSTNLHRRHLTESQRAMAAARIANLKPGDNQHTAGGANLPDLIGGGNSAGVPIATAADMLNVSERTVKAARAVQRDAVPELSAAVDSGNPLIEYQRAKWAVCRRDAVSLIVLRTAQPHK